MNPPVRIRQGEAWIIKRSRRWLLCSLAMVPLAIGPLCTSSCAPAQHAPAQTEIGGHSIIGVWATLPPHPWKLLIFTDGGRAFIYQDPQYEGRYVLWSLSGHRVSIENAYTVDSEPGLEEYSVQMKDGGKKLIMTGERAYSGEYVPF